MKNKKPVLNKFYKYADTIVKLKKISKSSNKILAERLDDGTQMVLSYEQSEILLHRIYTVGEVAKIVEKRADTLRKYEKKDLIPKPKKFGEKYKSYANWRYYDESDVYEMIEFFNTRVPGRPVKSNKETVNIAIKTLQYKTRIDF